MLLSFDRTDFPLIAVEQIGLEIHLLPVTIWQLEQFVAEAKGGAESGYADLAALNPDQALDQVTVGAPEQLLVTGILPEEALAFARWLGPGFDLPTVSEWRGAYAALRRTALPKHGLSSGLVEGVAGTLLDKFSAQPHLGSMLDLSLMRGGLVEWVRQDKKIVGLGAPRPEFHPNLWDPLNHEVNPIDLTERLPFFGFRLVRRGQWYLADRERVRYIC